MSNPHTAECRLALAQIHGAAKDAAEGDILAEDTSSGFAKTKGQLHADSADSAETPRESHTQGTLPGCLRGIGFKSVVHGGVDCSEEVHAGRRPEVWSRSGRRSARHVHVNRASGERPPLLQTNCRRLLCNFAAKAVRPAARRGHGGQRLRESSGQVSETERTPRHFAAKVRSGCNINGDVKPSLLP